MKWPLAVVCAAALLLGCHSGAKREAAQLVAVVDRFRQADPSARGPLADAVDAVVCTDGDVCAAKRACVASTRPTARGYALKAEVEATLADLHAGKITQADATQRGLPEKLDEAQRLLDEGHAALADCDAKVTALRLRYGI